MSSAGRFFFVQILLLLMISCGEESETNNGFPHIEFIVETDSLSSKLPVDGSFSIRMPHDWLEIDDESFAAAKNVINNDSTSYFGLELLEVATSVKGASCVVSKVASGAFSFDRLNEEYERSLMESFQTNDVEKGAFCFNGNNFIQYRVISKKIIAFKLFFNCRDGFYQIDYFIPKGIYEEEIRKVESSIGTITSLEIGRR